MGEVNSSFEAVVDVPAMLILCIIFLALATFKYKSLQCPGKGGYPYGEDMYAVICYFVIGILSIVIIMSLLGIF